MAPIKSRGIPAQKRNAESNQDQIKQQNAFNILYNTDKVEKRKGAHHISVLINAPFSFRHDLG